MLAWTLGKPGELSLDQKEVPLPDRSELLIRIDAVAVCATRSGRNRPTARRRLINGNAAFQPGIHSWP